MRDLLQNKWDNSDISTTKKLYYFSNKTTKNKEKQIENAISF